MASVYDVSEKMHKMRVKLYKNQLPSGEAYIARTANEASVSIGDVCASMKNRGGYSGGFDEAVQTVRHFFQEAMYQMADGFSVNLGFCAMHAHIGGTFKSDLEPYDPKKHPISFRFQALKPLRELRRDIGVIMEGYADVQGHITGQQHLLSRIFSWNPGGNLFLFANLPYY
jgi:hypothetical protein